MASNVTETAVSADTQVSATNCTYYGFSFRETAGATAVIRIYAGSTAAGTLLDSIALAANESAREWYGPQGLGARTGIYADVVSGTVEGSVRHG